LTIAARSGDGSRPAYRELARRETAARLAKVLEQPSSGLEQHRRRNDFQLVDDAQVQVPRAYSIPAYGESPKPDSPYFSDQAEMFARRELKPVASSEKEIEAQTVKRYRPGETPQPVRSLR
jgi:acyl-homoserine lactone acylase PvdQ